MKAKCLIVFFICWFWSFNVIAQYLVRGTVFSAVDSLTISGVTIKETLSGLTVQTNGNGSFTLNAKSPNSVLLVSAMGYYAQQYKASNSAELVKIFLVPSIVQLKEAVVYSGYQKLDPNLTVGSYAKVTNELINRVESSTILARLRDVVPGLSFNQKGSSNLSIRGQSTIFANAEPLIVLDNFPYDGDLNAINPNDVESVTVLKDAASTAIWGARAGNGVIVISTKKALSNQTSIQISQSLTLMDKPDLFYFPSLSAANAIEVEKMLFAKGGYQATENSLYKIALSPVVELLIAERDKKISKVALEAELTRLASKDVREDATRYLYRTGALSSTFFNISSNTSRHSYYLSASFDNNSTNLKANSWSRYSLNFRNQFTFFNDRLKVDLNLNRTQQKNEIVNMGLSAVRMTGVSLLYPYAELADGQGNALPIVKDIRQGIASNASNLGLLDWQYRPLEELDLPGKSENIVDQRIQFNVVYHTKFGLTANALLLYAENLGTIDQLRSLKSYFTRNEINRITSINADGAPSYPVPVGDIFDRENGKQNSINARLNLNFDRIWNSHNLSVMAGYELRSVKAEEDKNRLYGFDEEHYTFSNVNYLQTYPLYLNPAATANSIQNVNSLQGTQDNYLSMFSNLSYQYKQRYILNLTARKDQSNLFGVSTNQKGVPLYSLGGAWILSKEGFLKNSKLTHLKIRASFGYNGNIDKTLSAFTTANYLAGTGARQLTRLPYAQIQNPPNPELRWERNRVFNLGVDFSLDQGKLMGSIELYRKDGLDLIGSTIYPPSTGITSFRGNYASTRTKGIDISLTRNWLGRGKQSFTFSSFLNLSLQDEQLISYDQPFSVSSAITSPFNQVLQIGKPLFALFSYPSAGLDPKDGSPRILFNGMPSVDYNAIVSQSKLTDIVYHGTVRPKYYGVLQNNFGYKNLSLSMGISYKLGYFARRPTVSYTSLLAGTYGGLYGGDYTDRWKQSGDELTTIIPSMPLVNNTNRDRVFEFSDALVINASHVRLQDIRVNYLFDHHVSRNLKIKNLSIYGYIDNIGMLWRSNSFKLDPDYLTDIPAQTTYSFGIKLGI